MNPTRRQFLKGLFAAAVLTQVPFKQLLYTVDYSEGIGRPCLYLSPDRWELFQNKMLPQFTFEMQELSAQGIENIIWHGYPVIPFKGQIRRAPLLSHEYDGIDVFLGLRTVPVRKGFWDKPQ